MSGKDMVDFAIMIGLYVFFFYKKWRAEGNDIFLVKTAMYIYLSFVLYVTLMPIVTSLPFVFNHPYRPMNLVPFIDVLEGRGDFVRQVGLNIVMLMPFGFLLPLTQKGNTRLPKVLWYTFMLSLAIEILQPLINGSRSSDITDIITNVLGGLIGYSIYFATKPITMKILNFIRKNNLA